VGRTYNTLAFNLLVFESGGLWKVYRRRRWQQNWLDCWQFSFS